METTIQGRIAGTRAEAGSPFRPIEYEGVRLDGPKDKLIPLVDAIQFHCKLARLRTRLLVVSEAEGCVNLTWSTYAPAVFRGNRLLELVARGRLIDLLTVQESRAA